jgi:hypothetical protein
MGIWVHLGWTVMDRGVFGAIGLAWQEKPKLNVEQFIKITEFK